MTRRRASALLALGLLAFAGGQAAGARSGTAADGRIEVREQFDLRGGFFIEGYAWHVRIFSANRTLRAVADAVLLTGRAVVFELAPGSYRLVSSARPCDGNCGYLDPDANPCSVRFRMTSGKRLVASVRTRADRACAISIRQG